LNPEIELPNYGKHILLIKDKRSAIWKIYRHPDRVLDNLAIVEKQVGKKKPNKKWIVAKDYIDWIKSLSGNGYIYKIEEDK